jgi:hypothetical protein
MMMNRRLTRLNLLLAAGVFAACIGMSAPFLRAQALNSCSYDQGSDSCVDGGLCGEQGGQCIQADPLFCCCDLGWGCG